MRKYGPYSVHNLIHCKDTGETVNGNNYLNSKHWGGLRLKIYKKYDGICQRCKEDIPFSIADIHHRTYARMGNENENDLILYCKRCHKIIHNSKKKSREMSINLQDFCSKLTKEEKEEALTLLRKHFSYID